MQVNNERNLATQPLKEKQANSSDLIIPPVGSNGSENKPTRLNGTTTIPVNQPNGINNQEKVQSNGVHRPAQELIINGKPSDDLSNGVKKTDAAKNQVKSTVKTQMSDNSSNDSSLSSIDSNETAVIGQVNKRTVDEKNAQQNIANDDDEKCCNRWFKDAVLLASNFEDGKYVLSVSGEF